MIASEPAIFTDEAWRRNKGLYDLIRDMPFNRDLASGSLKPERFRHYMIQDAHYLVAFAQALSIAAAKADTPALVLQFAESASTAVLVERDLHTRYFKAFGLDPEQAAAVEISPTCHHYRTFLLAIAFREPLPVLAAALLPCFWIYREVGRHILAEAGEDNPYRAWIDTYAGEEFSDAVDRMIATTDELAFQTAASTRAAMHKAFARATQLEWMFWDSAYRLEGWPVVP